MTGWRGLPPWMVGVVVMVEGDEMRTGQCPPRDRPGVQNEPGSHEARPRSRARGRSRRPPQVAGHPVCPS